MLTPRLFIIVQTILCTYGYETGAPRQACDQMIPGHGQPTRTDPSPYSITFEQPSNTSLLYRVTVSKEQNALNFKGFLLKARPLDGTTADYIGEFLSYPSGTKLGQCGNKKQSVTHENKAQKNSVIVEWAPTVSECGKSVVFQATVVQSWHVVYTGVLSTKLDIPADCASLLPTTTPVPTTQSPATTTPCDKTSDKECESSSGNILTVTNLYILFVALVCLCLY